MLHMIFFFFFFFHFPPEKGKATQRKPSTRNPEFKSLIFPLGEQNSGGNIYCQRQTVSLYISIYSSCLWIHRAVV